MNVIVSQNAPKAIGPYSQATGIQWYAVHFWYGRRRSADGQAPGRHRSQTEQAVKNIAAILEAAGTDFSKVVKRRASSMT